MQLDILRNEEVANNEIPAMVTINCLGSRYSLLFMPEPTPRSQGNNSCCQHFLPSFLLSNSGLLFVNGSWVVLHFFSPQYVFALFTNRILYYYYDYTRSRFSMLCCFLYVCLPWFSRVRLLVVAAMPNVFLGARYRVSEIFKSCLKKPPRFCCRCCLQRPGLTVWLLPDSFG